MQTKKNRSEKNEALLEAMKAASAAAHESQRTDQVYGIQGGSPPIAPWPTRPCLIAFVDFDGVLNSEKSAQELGTRYRFSRSSVEALNELVRQTDAKIVITSTWREHWTLKENAEFLERDGLIPGRVLGKTSVSDGARGLEIDAWLSSVPYVVKSFVILDDRDDMAMHQERLVRVDANIGLTMEQARRALKILARPWKDRR